MPRIDTRSKSITGYARYEPRVITRNFDPAIKAQVHDALWMLSQQWRIGEYNGNDAGTIVKARVQTQASLLNRIASGSGTVSALDPEVPLEAQIEKLPIHNDLGLQIEWGNVWSRMLAKAYPSAPTLPETFRTAFPVDALGSSAPPEKKSNKEALIVRRMVTSRTINGYALYEFFRGGGNPATIAPGYPALAGLKDKFMQWVGNTYYSSGASGTSWSERGLEYKASVSAPMGTAASAAQHVLHADRYRDGRVDWHSFDLDNLATKKLTETGTAIPNGPAFPTPSTFSYIPGKVEFKGMPKGSWWEFEDRNIDIAAMLVQKHDLVKLAVMEFGLIYANDWFIIPHPVRDGAIVTIKAMVTTDVFGRHTLIERSGKGEAWKDRWQMYNNSKQSATGYLDKLFMIPRVATMMEGEPLERVVFLQDEGANMVFGVEEVVPNELSGGMDGKYASNELQKYLSDATPPVPEPEDGGLQYRLSSELPENWIPFLPVKKNPAAHGGREKLLQRGVMRRFVNGRYTEELIRPRTSILSIGIDTNTPYFIHEEAVNRSGISVETQYQRTRWYDGSTFLWTGRSVVGELVNKSSGLKFDFIEEE